MEGGILCFCFSIYIIVLVIVAYTQKLGLRRSPANPGLRSTATGFSKLNWNVI